MNIRFIETVVSQKRFRLGVALARSYRYMAPKTLRSGAVVSTVLIGC
jgi:hypothetical protein